MKRSAFVLGVLLLLLGCRGEHAVLSQGDFALRVTETERVQVIRGSASLWRDGSLSPYREVRFCGTEQIVQPEAPFASGDAQCPSRLALRFKGELQPKAYRTLPRDQVLLEEGKHVAFFVRGYHDLEGEVVIERASKDGVSGHIDLVGRPMRAESQPRVRFVGEFTLRR